MKIKEMTKIALMVCMITICSWLTVPVAIPFTMQTFAVFCTLLLLGGRYGLTTIIVYVIMGCMGLPVFSGFRGGIAHIMGPTGGYIIGFIFMAIFYLIFEPLLCKYCKLRLPVLAGGLMICYLIGTVWFKVIYGMRGTSYSVVMIISLCVLPYVVPDLIKLALAWIISNRINKSLMGIADYTELNPKKNVTDKKDLK